MKSIAKRVVLFIVLNIAVMLTVSAVLNIFDVRSYFVGSGIDYQQLLLFCLVWGMAGAFVSLALSRLMAKWMMGVQVIDPDTTQPLERKLLTTVAALVQKAKLPVMPEVGIYDSEEVNAFATGPSKARSLIAVSSGLLRRMEWIEVEGVLGHEISHIANGDMVTMTLLQGVVNAFVMFFARALAFVVTRMGRDRSSSRTPSPLLYTTLVFVFEIVFMLLGSIIIAAFSRYREFRADEGSSSLVGKEAMIKALLRLESVALLHDAKSGNPSFHNFKIAGSSSWMWLFATHPPVQQRIAHLQSHS